jgi:WD40 repeat protein
LQPIERAMRAARIIIGTAYSLPSARCRINLQALQTQFAPLDRIQYVEFFQAERSPEENPTALLTCTACQNALRVLHPMESKTSTPWFPSPPPPMTLKAERSLASHLEITAIAPSPTGRFAAVAAGLTKGPHELAIWDIASCQPVRSITSPGVIRHLVWSKDERVLFAGCGPLWAGGPGTPGPCIFVWDATTGEEFARLADALFGVRGMALSPDGRTLFASGMLGETRADGSTLDLWDIASGRIQTRVAELRGDEHDYLPFFTAVAFSPDGSLIFAGCNRYIFPTDRLRRAHAQPPWWFNRGVRAWKLDGMQELDVIREYDIVTAMSPSTDGLRLFTSGGRLTVWKLDDCTMFFDLPSDASHATAASPDCRFIARGKGYQEDNHGPYVDTAVELYDGRGKFLSLSDHRTPPSALAFAPAANLLIAGGECGELRFWNLPSLDHATDTPQDCW